jgi:rare lipoprotein A
MKILLHIGTLSLLLLGTSFFTACSQKAQTVKNPTATKHTSAARHRATMRSYSVRGKRYQPTYVEVGQVMEGISSWYGPNFHGKYTSNGEIYNMHAQTAAHKTWPMDTIVKVNNLQNGKSTIVRINDRGPFVSGRIIDCSYAAGKAIGLDKLGIAKVSIEVLGFSGKIDRPKPIGESTKSTPTRILLSNFGIQVGAFRNYSGAKITKQKYERLHQAYHPVIKKFDVDGAVLYRVWLMGFGSKQEALDFKETHQLYGAFIIRK